MSSLDKEPDVIRLAKELGLDARDSPVRAVVRFCLAKIDAWVEEIGGVRNISDLESMVSERLGLVFEEVWTDEELETVIGKYVAMGEGVFAFLRVDLDRNTFGTTLRRKNAAPDARDRYVAVIDCRGRKGARRFFTRWHEIAHLLTLEKELAAPVRRKAHDPLERVMDHVAGQTGFYEPLFRPAFSELVDEGDLLTFERVESLRRNHFPQASFQATLFACIRSLTTPAIYIEAAWAYKAADQRRIDAGANWLFREARPVAKLRAVEVVSNTAAHEEGFFIAPNMRIPETSLIHRLFSEDEEPRETGTENLRSWEHSKGKHLKDRDVRVEARRFHDRVIALVQPIGPGKGGKQERKKQMAGRRPT